MYPEKSNDGVTSDSSILVNPAQSLSAIMNVPDQFAFARPLGFASVHVLPSDPPSITFQSAGKPGAKSVSYIVTVES